MELLCLLLTATAGARAATVLNPNGGAVLLASSCPPGTFQVQENTALSCCPGTVSSGAYYMTPYNNTGSDPGYCCPTTTDCGASLLAHPGCANTTWSYFPNPTSGELGFCCEPGSTAYVEEDGATGLNGFACAGPGIAVPSDSYTLTSIAVAGATAASTTLYSLGTPSTTSTATSTAAPTQSSSSGTPLGAIAGAVVAVAVVAGIVILGIFYIRHRRGGRRLHDEDAFAADGRDGSDVAKPMMIADVEELHRDDGSSEKADDGKRMSELPVPDSPRELVGGEIHELPAEFCGFEMPPTALATVSEDEVPESGAVAEESGPSRPTSQTAQRQTAVENLLIDLAPPASLRLGCGGPLTMDFLDPEPTDSEEPLAASSEPESTSREPEQREVPTPATEERLASGSVTGDFPDRSGCVSPLIGTLTRNSIAAVSPPVSPPPESKEGIDFLTSPKAEGGQKDDGPARPVSEESQSSSASARATRSLQHIELVTKASDEDLGRIA